MRRAPLASLSVDTSPDDLQRRIAPASVVAATCSSAMQNRTPDRKVDKTEAKTFRLSPVKIARAIFSQQVRLKREGKNLTFVLEGRTVTQPESTQILPDDEVSVARKMREDLTTLLDGAPGSRKVLRYLAAIEHGLKHKDAGGLFMFDTSADRLRLAQRQLDGLCIGEQSAGLSTLRSRMVDAISARSVRSARATDDDRRAPISSFLVDHKLEVEEGCASDFDKAQAAWQGTPKQEDPNPTTEG
jgi:hypothetical protein